MTAFKDRPFTERWRQMGDQAEAAYVKVYSECDHEAFGWDRTKLNMRVMTLKMRYMPDFISTTQSGAWLTECVGFGADGILKFKVEKLAALVEWDRDMNTFVFVYCSTKNVWNMYRMPSFRKLCENSPIKSFPEGKDYYAIDMSKTVGVEVPS